MQNVVERVINLLIYLLQTSRPVTADDIRRTVGGYADQTDEAFHRMFERDKDVLRRLGVPLELEAIDAWEIDFGYRVDPEKYAMEDPGLTDEELAALSVASRMVRLGGGEAGVEGLMKLGGMERAGGQEPLGADLGPQSDILGELFAAVSERRPIRLVYRGGDRRVDPYGIGHHRGHWYLVGESGEGIRMYRIDRIERLELTGSPGAFDRPSDFDVRQFFAAHPWQGGGEEELKAVVEFSPDVAWWAARTLGVSPSEDGRLVAELPVSNQDAFVGWILSFGDQATVLSPQSIRREIVDRVAAAVEGSE